MVVLEERSQPNHHLQLTSETREDGNGIRARHYDYAADYNLRRFDEAHTTLHYDHPLPPDRLSALTPDGGARFEVNYDGNGNLLRLPGQSFAYNEKNELVRFTRSDGLVAEYRDDHLGLRVSKAITAPALPSSRTVYLGSQAEIRDGVLTCFVSVGALRVAAITGGTPHFLHDNGMGITAFVTDAMGQRVGTIDTLPFGNTVTASGMIDHRTFSLSPVDPESGLVYMRRSYYAPQLGRFLTPDLMVIYQPEEFLHNPKGLHLYAFVANDPLNKTDPTGMSFWSFVGAVAGAVLGLAIGIGIAGIAIATGGLAGIAFGLALAMGYSVFVTGVAYVAASLSTPGSAFGEFARGFMIGFNAGMNGALMTAIGGVPLGILVGTINFLAAFDGILQSPVYQGLLGWSSWLMPMSWLATGVGLAVFTINLLAQFINPDPLGRTVLERIHIEWGTGTIVMSGGLIRGPGGSGFNLGNFVFMPEGRKNYDSLLRHETGHTLAVAAFGSMFLFFDAINENWLGAGTDDYGERVAESHAKRGPPIIPMWG